MRITAVPLHKSDLVRRASANGFAVTEAWSPPRRIPAHAHASLSITILLEGAFDEHYRPLHRPHVCAPGCMLVRPSGEIHENYLGREGARTLSVELDPSRLELYGKSLAPIVSLGLRREGAFLDIGLAMSAELQQRDAAAALALEGLSLELLARLVRMAESRGCALAPTWVARAKDAIYGRFHEQTLRVSDLARELGVHPVYFARMFRRHFRVTPGEYIRRLRLEWARHEVLRTSKPVSWIAQECGFADQSHLARAFRRRYGIAPSTMRCLSRVGESWSAEL